MSPKRGDFAGPPGWGEEWAIRFLDNKAAKGWEDLCAQVPGNTTQAWYLMRRSPAPSSWTSRHSPLFGDLSRGVVQGRSCPRWQIEVTGSGRIWYLVDEERRTVWIDYASPRHPKATD